MRFPPSCFDRTVFPLGMARIFWPFLTLESVSLVVRTAAALYSFSMTAATSSILAVGGARSLMVVGRWINRWTYRCTYRWATAVSGP